MPGDDGYPTAEELDLGTILNALGDPNRRRVVIELAAQQGPAEIACSSFEFPLARSTQTHLFNVLRLSGLIVSNDYGNHRGVSLRREVVDSRFPGLLDLLAKEAPARSA